MAIEHLETDGADGCTTLGMYLTALNCTLIHDGGKFYIMCILPQFKKLGVSTNTVTSYTVLSPALFLAGPESYRKQWHSLCGALG